jgi:hypothetical protein
VSPVEYELGFYIPEDDILHSHYRENLKSYMSSFLYVDDVRTSQETDLRASTACYGDSFTLTLRWL